MKARGKPFAAEFDAALDLWHSGDAEGAISQLEALAISYPGEAAIHGMLGSYLYEQGGLVEARSHAAEAVRLSPKSELAARAHFHILYDLGLVGEALEELRRFLAISDSDELRGEWSNLVRQVESQLHND